MPEQKTQSEPMPWYVKVLLAVMILGFAVGIPLLARSEQKQEEDSHLYAYFAVAFGIQTVDPHAPRVVDDRLRKLADETCNLDRFRHLYSAEFPSEAKRFEAEYNAGLKRLKIAAEVAQKRGFQIPDVVEKVQHRPQWETGTKFADLKCWE